MARNLQTTLGIGDAIAFKVLAFREVHELGRPAYLEVDALFGSYLDPEDIIAQTGELEFGYDDGALRKFTGLVESVTVVGSSAVGNAARTYQYSFVLVTQFTLMGPSRTCRILQEVNVQDAVEKVLKEAAPDLKVEWRLKGDYPKRAYVVQYQESDLAFVSRLFEAEGIYYFFEAGDDGELSLVVCDDSTAAQPIDGDETLHVRVVNVDIAKDSILEISDGQSVVSGKFVLRDFNFEKPKIDMTSTGEAAAHTDLEVYDYPGGYFEPADGKRLAKLRLEAEQVNVSTLSFVADCTRVSVGRKLKVADAGAADGEWFVTSVVHEFREEEEGKTVCRAGLIPAKTPFRPARVTPRPVIEGPQTASVVCMAGAPAESIHTDEHGRCKVKFHWDLGPARDEKATAWMRVTQLQTSGSMMLPRFDWEVVVEFLEGDPDRPIVAGRLYNGLYMPPYALPEGKTRTSIQTSSTPGGGGTNEIRFEDKSGSEEIMLHSQKDTNVAVANNKDKNVGNNETLSVGSNSTTTVGSNQTVKISKGAKHDIKADQTVVVGGTRSLEVNAVAAWSVGGSSTTTVGGMQSEQIGNPLEALIALAVAKAAEIAAAKAKDAVAAVQGAVQGKIDQALGPVKDLAGKADALGGGLNALGNGDLSALGGVVGGAGGLGGMGAMAAAMGGGGGGGGGDAGGGGGGDGGGGGASGAVGGVGDKASALNIAASNMLDSALGSAIQSAASKAVAGLDKAAGVDADGAGGSSAANEGGPEGGVDGVDATDRAKGPGHSTYDVSGSHSEKVGALKVLGALSGINTNIAGNMTQNVGAAIVHMAYGDHGESVAGSKKEKELGLVISAKGESEHVAGSKMAMIGGLVLDKVGGNMSLEAGANLTLLGAMHKIEASTAITLKCGSSEVVISADGVTIKSAMVTFTGGKIQLPKPAAEGG
jgi:type VI secretion system secreted protein VgrG